MVPCNQILFLSNFYPSPAVYRIHPPPTCRAHTMSLLILTLLLGLSSLVAGQQGVWVSGGNDGIVSGRYDCISSSCSPGSRSDAAYAYDGEKMWLFGGLGYGNSSAEIGMVPFYLWMIVSGAKLAPIQFLKKKNESVIEK